MKSRFLCALALLLCFSGNLFSRQTTIIDMVNRGWEDLQRETDVKYEFELGGIGWVKAEGDIHQLSYSLIWSKDLTPEEAAEIGKELAFILFNTVASEKDRERIFQTEDIFACFELSFLFPSSIGLDGKHDRSKMDPGKADHVGIWNGKVCVSVWDPQTGYSRFAIREPLKVGQEEAPDEK